MTGWRDVDAERPSIGFRLTWHGGEVHVGRRLYRWLWRR